ncbi:MAG: cadherin-like domain-containing protein, partial [Planctomycetota bacterium]
MRYVGIAACMVAAFASALVTGCGGGGGGAPPTYPPTARDDAVFTALETPVNFDVLANDADPEGRPLVVTVLTPPAGGTLVEESDGTFTYTPAASFTGFESFTYEVTDDQGLTDTATATIVVNVTIQLQMTEAKGLFTPNTEGVGE